MPAKRRTSARAAALAYPRGLHLDLARLVPSGRSLAIAFALAGLAGAGYGLAWHTPLFALRSIEVVGVSGPAAVRVKEALADLDGRSLAALHSEEVDRRLAPVPDVVEARYDRAFPHTLVVFVEPERPVAVLRRGSESWLVSARGRVIARLHPGARLRLPRIWAGQEVAVAVGAMISDLETVREVRVLALPGVRALPAAVRSIRVDAGETALVLRSGLELRLGDDAALGLKLAIARAVLPRLAPSSADGTAYLDVGVVGRPVAGFEDDAQP